LEERDMALAEDLFDIYWILDRIEKKPSLHLASSTYSEVAGFVEGFMWVLEFSRALPDFKNRDVREHPPFEGFGPFVETALNSPIKGAGWNFIIRRTAGGDEAKALKLFFRLLHEYRAQLPSS
jgi:hypothetical protein